MKIFKKITQLSLLIMCGCHLNIQAESAFPETSGLVKAGGKNVLLIGNQINIGDIAPNFKVVDANFNPVMLHDYQEKFVLLSIVPSLDTGICSLQTKRFNEAATTLSDDIVMLSISNDLPFAQKRFCKDENIENVITLSDAVWRDLGHQYGLLIKDMGLLTRAIFIINKEGKVVYKELVSDISKHPDYDKALATLSALSTQSKSSVINKETTSELINNSEG